MTKIDGFTIVDIPAPKPRARAGQWTELATKLPRGKAVKIEGRDQVLMLCSAIKRLGKKATQQKININTWYVWKS